METKIKKNINTIGKIGRILTMILIVLMILAGIADICGIGIAAAAPDDALNVKISGTADVTAKGKFLESVANAVRDSSEGGDGKIMVDDSVAIGDVKNSVPEDITVTKTENGIILGVQNKDLDISIRRILYCLCISLAYIICAVVTLFMLRALMRAFEKCDTPFTDDIVKRIRSFGFSLIPFVLLRGLTDSAWGSILQKNLDINFNIDLTVIFAVLIVFVLAMIFGYGAELQKQSDETL